jgi:hypothetical protein
LLLLLLLLEWLLLLPFASDALAVLLLLLPWHTPVASTTCHSRVSSTCTQRTQLPYELCQPVTFGWKNNTQHSGTKHS